MTTCECPYLPEKYHTTHFGATDPATIQEYNPWCPEHGHLKEGTAPATTTTTETDRSTTMTTHTPQPKPAWAPDDYPEYADIVKSWGYEITDTRVFGCYQGDIGYLLRDGDRHGLVVIGYGSCSACDDLEAAAPWGDDADWSSIIELAARLKREIHWEDTHKALMEWVNTTPENHWWSYDDNIVEWLNSHGAKLTPINN